MLRTLVDCVLEIEPNEGDPRTLLVARTFATAAGRYLLMSEACVSELRSSVSDACAAAMDREGSDVPIRVVVGRGGETFDSKVEVLR